MMLKRLLKQFSYYYSQDVQFNGNRQITSNNILCEHTHSSVQRKVWNSLTKSVSFLRDNVWPLLLFCRFLLIYILNFLKVSNQKDIFKRKKKMRLYLTMYHSFIHSMNSFIHSPALGGVFLRSLEKSRPHHSALPGSLGPTPGIQEHGGPGLSPPTGDRPDVLYFGHFYLFVHVSPGA